MEISTKPTNNVGKKIRVGIWLPLPRGVHWSGEGIARTTEFIIMGMNDSGLLKSHVELTIYTSRWLKQELEDKFKKILKDNFDDVKFIYVTHSMTPPWMRKLLGSVGDLLYAGPFFLNKEKFDFERKKRKSNDIFKYYLFRRDISFGNPLGEIQFFVRKPKTKNNWLVNKIYRARVSRFCKKHDINIKELAQNRVKVIRHLGKNNSFRKNILRSGHERVIDGVKNFLTSIPLFGRFARKFYALDDHMKLVRAIQTIVKNENEVDVWWAPSPMTPGIELLPGPKFINFWDFFVGEFGYLWDKATGETVYYRCNSVFGSADSIITQSATNKYTRIKPFDVSADKIFKCQLSYPKQYPKYVKSFYSSGKKSTETLAEAASIIRDDMFKRAHMLNQHETYLRMGTQLQSLSDFAFEHEKFMLCSTQNRPYKNLEYIIDLMPKILREFDEKIYLILTADLDLNDMKDPVVKKIHKYKLYKYIFTVPRVPDKVHAALSHCASLTIHPSLAEGGVGTYPFMEGMIMGTPGLSVVGDHTREGVDISNDYASVTIPDQNRNKAVEKIVAVLKDTKKTYQEQLPVFEAHLKWSWDDVGRFYVEALSQTAGNEPDLEYLSSDYMQERSAYFELRGDRHKVKSNVILDHSKSCNKPHLDQGTT